VLDRAIDLKGSGCALDRGWQEYLQRQAPTARHLEDKMTAIPNSETPVLPTVSQGPERRSWRGGLTVTVPWWLAMLVTLLLTASLFPLGPLLSVWLSRRKEAHPYAWAALGLTILLFVYWFTSATVTRIGLMSRVVSP
jgi:hypothetical protein